MSEAGGNVRLHEYQEPKSATKQTRAEPSTKQQPESERRKVRTAAPAGHAVSRATRRPAVALGGLAQRSRGSRGRGRAVGLLCFTARSPPPLCCCCCYLPRDALQATSHPPTRPSACLAGCPTSHHTRSHPLPDLPLLRTRRWAPRKNHPHSLAHTLAHSLFVWRRRSCEIGRAHV